MTEYKDTVEGKYFVTDLVKKITGASKMQLIFFGMFLIIFPVLIPFLREFNALVQMRKSKNPNYLWPQYEDLYISLGAMVAIFVYYRIFSRLMMPFCRGLIS